MDMMRESEKRIGVVLPVSGSMLLPRTKVYIWMTEMEEELRRLLTAGGNDLVALTRRSEIQGSASEPAEQSGQHDPDDGPADDRDSANGFCHTGVTFRLMNIQEVQNGCLVEIETLERVRADMVERDGRVYRASFQPQPDDEDLTPAMQSEILRYMKDIIRDVSAHFQGADAYLKAMDEIHDVDQMIVWMSRFMPIDDEQRHEYLKIDSDHERALRFLDALMKQKEAVRWNIEIGERMSDKTSKYYRDQALRQQLEAIKKELGEDQEEPEGPDSYRTKINGSAMPEAVKKAALEEVRKLEAQPKGSAETSVIQNYLDFMLALPWAREQSRDWDLSEAEKILNRDHYGLEDVKKRIIEHLAVMKLRGDNKGSILLLVGPPGTGKTSLGRSIARALGRAYVRLSLGGIRDESEIRGHRLTYVGALPGRILNGIKQAGTTDPVMVLDEVDKIQAGGFSGDPSSALLEVLDPEQNATFTDHYLNLPYDLSDVFFIATANSLETIPAPLLDRMEVIEISSYTEEEKFHIAEEHLIPEVLTDTGMTADQLVFEEDAVRSIISDYTAEGGVRGLKKALTKAARSVSAEVVKGTAVLPRRIAVSDLEGLLGRRVSFHERAAKENPPGVVTGLAWTPVGGEILFIETAALPGDGQIILTGQLGDVMQESARIALSLLQSRLPAGTFDFRKHNIHIHVPSGSVKKDGPSAGTALFTALASLTTGRKVDSRLAMTGEITLRGQVTPIGGLKEKLLAARRAGIRKALIPRENAADLKDLPEEVRSQLTIVTVDTVDDVLREAMGISLPKPDVQEMAWLEMQAAAGQAGGGLPGAPGTPGSLPGAPGSAVQMSGGEAK